MISSYSNRTPHASLLGIHWQTRNKRDQYGVFSVRSEHLFSVDRRASFRENFRMIRI